MIDRGAVIGEDDLEILLDYLAEVAPALPKPPDRPR